MKRTLPEAGFVRLSQIIGSSKAGIPAIIPVSKSTWWSGVKSGRYPQSVKLSERTTAWRVEDILALIEQKSAA
jgi:prophage regulatory protein